MKHIFLFLMIFAVLMVGVWVIAEESAITFSHKFHIEGVESACTDCHDQALESTTSTDDLLPDKDMCLGCHEEEAIIYNKADWASIRAFNFSHQAHLESDEDAACLECHQGVEEKEDVGTYHLPARETCESCHGRADYAEEKELCLQCHQADFNFVPDDHGIGWMAAHGIEAEIATAASCNHCHQESYCISCHEGDNLDRQVHPLNYRYHHGIDAKGNKEECMTCHQEHAYCVECHQIEGVVPKNHHFANWTNNIAGDGGKHAKEALYDFDNCMSCHNDAYVEPTCSMCHGQ